MVLYEYMMRLLLALYIFFCAIGKPDLFVSNQTVVCTIHTSNKTVILRSLIFVIYFKQTFSSFLTNYLCYCGSYYKNVHIYSQNFKKYSTILLLAFKNFSGQFRDHYIYIYIYICFQQSYAATVCEEEFLVQFILSYVCTQRKMSSIYCNVIHARTNVKDDMVLFYLTISCKFFVPY